jgi:putative protease
MGDRVFRVRNASLMGEAESTFGNEIFKGNNGIVPVKAHVVARLGEPLSIGFSLMDDDVTEPVKALGGIVEAARTRPLTEEALREHVGRIGGTPYSIRSWDIALDEGAGAGFSEVHKLRGEALEQLGEEALAPWRERALSAKERSTTLVPAQKGKVHVAVVVADAAGAKAALRAGADMLYLHTLSFEADAIDTSQRLGAAASGKDRQWDALKGFSAKIPVKQLLPAVVHDYDLEALTDTLGRGSILAANNLGEIEFFAEQGYEIEGGQSLNVVNEQSLRALARLGLKQAWLSPELSCHNIATFSTTAPLPLALTVFGRQEVMVTEHCLLMAQGPCDQNCAACARRKAPRLLEDRKGYKLPVRTDNNGRSHLFTAVALDLIPSRPELVALGISTMVVDATLLTTKEIKAEVERTVRARDLAVRGAGSLPKREGYTTGHFFRGVY